MFSVDPADPTPIYAQLERSIRAMIATGQLIPGDKLPTVRALSRDLDVNTNTVARVYAELEQAGVVVTKRGAGTFVREQPPAPPQPKRDTERELRPLVDRLLADASMLGFSMSEVVHYMRALEVRHHLKEKA